MAHRPRSEMISETRAKLLAAGRKAFGTVGYAAASMDDFTAEVGLTRGALYHHFGDKKGLFSAVLDEIDAEMTARIQKISAAAPDPWTAFVEECVAYVELAMEPEIKRIVYCDGPGVLGDPAAWASASGCIRSMTASLEKVQATGRLGDVDAEALARMLSGATFYAAQWIASSEEGDGVAQRAIHALRLLMNGLLGEDMPASALPAPRIRGFAAL